MISTFQVCNILAFCFAISMNIASSLRSKPFGASNSDVSSSRKTAFTPAGYAFSIWGVIYFFAAFTIIWQALPAQKEFSSSKLSVYLMLNFLANGCWIVAFAYQTFDLWLSTVIIFFGILIPLVILHRKLKIGDYSLQLSLGEQLVQAFISIYLGWVCVATIANISLSLVHYSFINQSAFSISMQFVAFGLGVFFLLYYLDWTFAASIAWALIAIAEQQKRPDYPGNQQVVKVGYTLGSLLLCGTIAVFVYRLYWLVQLQSTPSADRVCLNSYPPSIQKSDNENENTL